MSEPSTKKHSVSGFFKSIIGKDKSSKSSSTSSATPTTTTTTATSAAAAPAPTTTTTTTATTPSNMAPVILILGAGPRVGAAVAEKFAAGGYKVALASRKGTNSVNEQGYLSLQADFANPNSIPPVFEKVKAEFGVPSVVVYNAAGLTPPSDEASALSVTSDKITSDLAINVTSPWVAAQEAEKGFTSLPSGGTKLFIYTGNVMNVQVIPMPIMITLGIGKAASGYWVSVADQASSAKGYRFIYADQRTPEGGLTGRALDGPAHGDFYWSLAQNNAKDIPWQATFVKDKGYTKF